MEGQRRRPNKKKLKSWQRRRIRRIKLMIKAALVFVLVIIFIVLVKSAFPYEEVDLCDYVVYEYSGYNNRGSTSVSMNEELVSKLMQRLIADYDDHFIHFRHCEPADYNAFYNSLSVYAEAPDNLSNGSKFTYVVSYDKELAKKIRLDVKENKREVTVSGLTNAAVVSLDELFAGIDIVYEGISPALKATLIDNTTNPYLENVIFTMEGEQENYAEGDVIRVRATVSEDDCIEKHFVIDALPEDYCKDFVVTGGAGYLQDSGGITKEILNEAVAAANTAFTRDSAQEYGVRVYFEANTPPVYINKKSTFEWKSFNPLSAYFKVAHKDIAGQTGKEFNMLDIVYSGVLTQADNKTVSVEAVVRFSNIIKNPDGTLTCDFSKPRIVTCSHMDSRIKKNVLSNYEDNYSIDKLSLK